MKTIIGFDSWTVGARYFERLVPAFKKQGYRLLLIHIGSWGHDQGRAEEEMIGDLCVRDISYYKNKTLSDILEIENPSAILFMSTRALAHMAFNRYARHKKIPTCHMYHGLVMIQAFGVGEYAYKINYYQHLNLFIKRILKNIFILIPTYIKSMLETGHTARDWLNIIDNILRRGVGVFNRENPYVSDTGTDIGCVYTAADVEHMHRNYKIPLAKIYVVGNPDLLMFDLLEGDLGCVLDRKESSETIIYIDTALSESGIVFDSTNDFIRHILQTRDALLKVGLNLLVKLHPAHYRTETPKILVSNNIVLCENNEFIRQIKQSYAVIVEPSSAAIIPALIGVPVLLAQYGRLSSQNYGAILKAYPRSRLLTSLSDIWPILLAEQNSLSARNVLDWININKGPMPAENMPERAAQAMCDLIATKTQILGG